MSEVLPEVDHFDTDVVVPDGDDWMDDAASVVANIAAKLVNRTFNLKLHTGKLDAANTWLQQNVFKSAVMRAVDANTAALVVENVDPIAAHQHVAHIEAGPDGQVVRVYAGGDGFNKGGFIVAYNARWTKAGGWVQPDQTKPSIALIWRYADVRLVGKPAATATAWASWQSNTITGFGATMLSEVFQAARMQAVGNTNADPTNGYRYTTAIARTSPIPLGSLWGALKINADGHVQRSGVTGDDRGIWIPLRVPPFCTFQTVRVRLVSTQTSPSSYDFFYLFKRNGTGAWVSVPSGDGGAPPPGTLESDERVVELHAAASQEVHDDEEWAYKWMPPESDGAADSRIIGVAIDWTDVGPNNRVG